MRVSPMFCVRFYPQNGYPVETKRNNIWSWGPQRVVQSHQGCRLDPDLTPTVKSASIGSTATRRTEGLGSAPAPRNAGWADSDPTPRSAGWADAGRAGGLRRHDFEAGHAFACLWDRFGIGSHSRGCWGIEKAGALGDLVIGVAGWMG